jgi:hypothetical protein
MLGSVDVRVALQRWGALLALLVLGACAGRATPPGPAANLPFALPPLPRDSAPAPRHIAAGQQATLDGNLVFDSSGGTPAGSSYVLSAPAGGVQWALYQFDAVDPLQSIELDFTLTLPGGQGEAYAGVSNYARNAWEIKGPFTTAPQTVDLSGADYISSGNHFYFFILAYDGATVTVNQSVITSAGGGFSVGGTVTDAGSHPLQNAVLTLQPGGASVKTDASGHYSFSGVSAGSYTVQAALFGYNFSPSTHAVSVSTADVAGVDFTGTGALSSLFIAGTVTDGTNPLSNVTVYLAFEDKSALTDANGHYSFTGLAANIDRRVVPVLDTYSFNPPELFVDQAGDLGGQDFAGTAHTIPATVTYDGQMKPWLFSSVCMNCHNSAYSGAQRHGAPTGVNWDTYSGTTSNQKDTGNTYVHLDFMPPAALGYKTTQFQKDLFQKWADGGYLEH